ncbi:hydroxyacid dehydrogenase [Falsiroseomonas bella]|uniref:Hydroxyacid dehydrogenase n=1 Tax=Falsiroseomonas bella TaxID=2184016 RepID=A0A317FKM6_9PROT|nr:NAD(P)-dependent oxidoreductase [Falsiroseomonas bella]PWS38912.1 hydroxyacid dehydrogenase [Falsiroseomonas bella]
MRVLLTHTPEMRVNYYPDRALAALRQVAEVVLHDGEAPLSGLALARAAAGCQAIVADRATPGTKETFDNAPDLVAFLRVAVDVSTIDIAAASSQGVLVTQATPGFGASVSELAIGMMVDLARNVSEYTVAYQAGRLPEPRMGRQLEGRTLGLVGYGLIARRIATVALAMRMSVIAHDPFAPIEDAGVESVPLDRVWAESDVVMPLAVSIPATRHIVNAASLAAMKRGVLLVNLSRGELVDEAALAAALGSGHVAGFAMDVGSAPDQRPDPALAARANVVATPHIGGLTPEAAEHQAMDTVRQVADLARGVMPERGLNAKKATRLARLGITPSAAPSG